MILKRASIHLMLITTSLLLIIIPAINKTPSQQVAEKAMAAATHFLFLIDTEEYLKSWESTSNALKNILPRDAWHEQLTEIRQLLGPIIGRDHRDISYTRSSPDVPAGEYVVLTFFSQFRDRAFATETVTVKLGLDNIWRVAGYFVRYGDPPPDG
jgi:hypothetical protein